VNAAPVTIRDLALSDRASWDPLWAGYLAFYDTKLDANVTDTTWARLLDPNAPLFALVAAQDGVLVGFAHCLLHAGTWNIGPLCYLEDLFVAPDIRGGGIGRALIEAVYMRADALGCERVHWLTDAHNTTAQALYDRIARRSGYIQYRRR